MPRILTIVGSNILNIPWAILLILVLALLPFYANSTTDTQNLEVFVSVLPQKYFVEKIAGQNARVNVMVGPGQSPATFEPTPKKMSQLAKAQIYFSIGTPFESVWMKRLQSTNPHMKIVDVSAGIPLRAIEKVQLSTGENELHSHSHASENLKDPHIWTDPQLVKKISHNIMRGLVQIDPHNKVLYHENYQRFSNELDRLDREIQNIISHSINRQFMVFHPSWGYFADRYGLTQIPIESEGKTPAAKTLSHIIKYAHKNDIRVIIVQEQIRSREAETIASEIGGKVIVVDPLSEDYLNNLKAVANVFVEAMS